MNREEQEQFSWVRMSHFNDPRDDASHIICNYDGIDLVRGARRRSAKLDFEKFLLLLSSWNWWHDVTREVSLFTHLLLSDISEFISQILGCFFFFSANHRGCRAKTIWAGAPFRERPSQSWPGIRIQPVNAQTGQDSSRGRVAQDTRPPSENWRG